MCHAFLLALCALGLSSTMSAPIFALRMGYLSMQVLRPPQILEQETGVVGVAVCPKCSQFNDGTHGAPRAYRRLAETLDAH